MFSDVETDVLGEVCITNVFEAGPADAGLSGRAELNTEVSVFVMVLLPKDLRTGHTVTATVLGVEVVVSTEEVV